MSERRHALVVGGTRGIGRAVVRRFHADGHVVSLLGRHEPAEVSLRHVHAWTVDVTDDVSLRHALREIVERNGPLSSLVLLQRYRRPPTSAGADDAWHGELAVSLTSTRTVIEELRGSFRPEGGAVVFVSSNASRLVADEQPVGYHAAKAALGQMARYYAASLGRSGIRVNCVSPGGVVKEESLEWYSADEPLRQLYGRIAPLGRTGSSEEVAAAIAFLCSPDASFVNGHDLVVDGGLSVLWQESLARRAAGLERTLGPTPTEQDR